MSRKANCWDNAPQEGFFGHVKDGLDLAFCGEYNGLLARIDDLADFTAMSVINGIRRLPLKTDLSPKPPFCEIILDLSMTPCHCP